MAESHHANHSSPLGADGSIGDLCAALNRNSKLRQAAADANAAVNNFPHRPSTTHRAQGAAAGRASPCNGSSAAQVRALLQAVSQVAGVEERSKLVEQRSSNLGSGAELCLAQCTSPSEVAAALARDIAVLNASAPRPSGGEAGKTGAALLLGSSGSARSQAKRVSLRRLGEALFAVQDVCDPDSAAISALEEGAIAPPPILTLSPGSAAAAWSALFKPLAKRVVPNTSSGEAEAEGVRLGAVTLLRLLLDSEAVEGRMGVAPLSSTRAPSGQQPQQSGLQPPTAAHCSPSALTDGPHQQQQQQQLVRRLPPRLCDLAPALPYLIPALCRVASTAPPWVLYPEAGVFAADCNASSGSGAGDPTAGTGSGGESAATSIIEEHRRGKVVTAALGGGAGSGGRNSSPSAAGVLVRPGSSDPAPSEPSEAMRLATGRCLRALLGALQRRAEQEQEGGAPGPTHQGGSGNSSRSASSSHSLGLMDAYWVDVVFSVHALSRDPCPDVRVLACESLLPLLIALAPAVAKHVATPLARSLCAGGITHKLARVRAASLCAFSALVLCVDTDRQKSAAGEALLTLLGCAGTGIEGNTLAVASFYARDVSVNHAAALSQDPSDRVRLAFAAALADWLHPVSGLPDRYDFTPRLAPYLLSCLTDPCAGVRVIAGRALDACGAEWEAQHSAELLPGVQHGVDRDRGADRRGGAGSGGYSAGAGGGIDGGCMDVPNLWAAAPLPPPLLEIARERLAATVAGSAGPAHRTQLPAPVGVPADALTPPAGAPRSSSTPAGAAGLSSASLLNGRPRLGARLWVRAHARRLLGPILREIECWQPFGGSYNSVLHGGADPTASGHAPTTPSLLPRSHNNVASRMCGAGDPRARAAGMLSLLVAHLEEGIVGDLAVLVPAMIRTLGREGVSRAEGAAAPRGAGRTTAGCATGTGQISAPDPTAQTPPVDPSDLSVGDWVRVTARLVGRYCPPETWTPHLLAVARGLLGQGTGSRPGLGGSDQGAQAQLSTAGIGADGAPDFEASAVLLSASLEFATLALLETHSSQFTAQLSHAPGDKHSAATAGQLRRQGPGGSTGGDPRRVAPWVAGMLGLLCSGAATAAATVTPHPSLPAVPVPPASRVQRGAVLRGSAGHPCVAEVSACEQLQRGSACRVSLALDALTHDSTAPEEGLTSGDTGALCGELARLVRELSSLAGHASPAMPGRCSETDQAPAASAFVLSESKSESSSVQRTVATVHQTQTQHWQPLQPVLEQQSASAVTVRHHLLRALTLMLGKLGAAAGHYGGGEDSPCVALLINGEVPSELGDDVLAALLTHRGALLQGGLDGIRGQAIPGMCCTPHSASISVTPVAASVTASMAWRQDILAPIPIDSLLHLASPALSICFNHNSTECVRVGHSASALPNSVAPGPQPLPHSDGLSRQAAPLPSVASASLTLVDISVRLLAALLPAPRDEGAPCQAGIGCPPSWQQCPAHAAVAALVRGALPRMVSRALEAYSPTSEESSPNGSALPSSYSASQALIRGALSLAVGPNDRTINCCEWQNRPPVEWGTVLPLLADMVCTAVAACDQEDAVGDPDSSDGALRGRSSHTHTARVIGSCAPPILGAVELLLCAVRVGLAEVGRCSQCERDCCASQAGCACASCSGAAHGDSAAADGATCAYARIVGECADALAVGSLQLQQQL